MDTKVRVLRWFFFFFCCAPPLVVGPLLAPTLLGVGSGIASLNIMNQKEVEFSKRVKICLLILAGVWGVALSLRYFSE